MTQQQPGLIRQVLDDARTLLTDPLGRTGKSIARPIRAATWLVLAVAAALVVWAIVKVVT